MLMYMTSVTLYVVLSCAYMETKAQDEDSYVHTFRNTTFLNSKLPVRIFSGANRDLLVVTKDEVYSVKTTVVGQVWQVTRSQLVRKVKSLYDAVILYSTQILFSDGTTCLKSLSLQDGAIKPYVGSCNETLSRNGPRLEARLQTPKCLARTDKTIYITDEQSREIKAMLLWDGKTGSEDAFTSEVYTVFSDTAVVIVAPSYMTTCGEEIIYITVLHGVIEVRLQYNDFRFLTGSKTRGLADTDPVAFYHRQPTTTSFNEPQGIIQLRSGLLAVADSLNNRLRFVFPILSPNGTLTNITVSVCGDGLSSKDGDMQSCVLSRPHSLNVIGDQILIGQLNGIRILSDYRTVYSELATTFRNVYNEEGLAKVNLTGARTLQSTVWENVHSRYSAAFGIDGNLSRFSLTRSIPNQWWKIYLQESKGPLDRIKLYKRDDSCVVTGWPAGIECYWLLYDLSVLTSNVDEPWDLSPALNNPNWILCIYRVNNFFPTENIRCKTEVTSFRHLAFFVEQDSGVAIAGIEIYVKFHGDVIGLNTFASCILPTTQPLVSVPFFEGGFATTGSVSTTGSISTTRSISLTESISATVPTVERTTTIEHTTTNQGVIEESKGGPRILNLAIGGGILLTIVIITGVAVYYWRRKRQRPDGSATTELRSRQKNSENSSDLARPNSPKQSIKSLTDVNSKHEDHLVGSHKYGSPALISVSSYHSDVARDSSPQPLVKSLTDANSKGEDRLVGSRKSYSSARTSGTSYNTVTSEVTKISNDKDQGRADTPRKHKEEKKEKKNKRDKKQKKDKKHEKVQHSSAALDKLG